MHKALHRALWLATLVAGILPGAALAAGLDRSFFARVDRGLEGGLEIFNAPGLSVAIVEGDEVVYAKGFGFANKSNGIPADADTLYYIGSTTKALTATLAMILRDRGIVALDAPVQDYLPASIRVPRDPAGQSPITLRHLLSHTAGLPKDPPNRKNLKIEGPIDPAVWDVYTISDLYEALATTELESAVGETWRYSNMGMGLAGHVLERAAGKPYEALLKEHILEPLGMNDTAITLDESQVRRLAAFYWDAEGNRTEQPRARFGEVAAMGGVTSSVRDMAKFAILQLKDHDRPGDPISLATIEEMRRPVIDTGRAFLGVKMKMGIGWWIRSPKGSAISYEHAGEVDGHTSAFWYSPEHDVAAVVLCNTANLSTLMLQAWLVRILEEASEGLGEKQ